MTPPTSRRAFLRHGTALALTAAVAGCRRGDVATPDADPVADADPALAPSDDAVATARERLRRRYGDRFDRVVDVVEAGAMPDGSRPIDPVLERVVDDDTLVVFPPGEYLLGAFAVRDVANVGLVAPSPRETRIVPAMPASEIDHLFLRFLDVSDFLIEGFTLDYRASGAGGATAVVGRGDFVARDLRIRGTMPDETLPNSPATFRFSVREPSATGTVDGLTLRDGGHDGGNAIGLYVGKEHAGTLAFVDCTVENFPNNGLYASAPGRDEPGFRGDDGTVHVRGGRYANNNVANVRLGTTGSTARDVRIVVDRVPPSFDGAMNARGLRLRNGARQVVEDCDIVIGDDAGYGFGGVVFHPDAGPATVRNTAIRVDRDELPAVRALDDEGRDGRQGPTLENVAITGSASGGWTVAIAERDDVTLADCSIRGTGRQRNGVSFTACENCVVRDGEIAVTGVPLRRRDSTVRTPDLDTDE